MIPVKASQTLASSSHIVLPNDTNTLGNLMGGQLLNWIDIIAAISAHRHCKRVVVTASVGNVSFKKPIKLGDIVTLEAKVSRSFTTSMEVVINVSIESHASGEKNISNQAMFTFVAVDQIGKAIEVPELVPETDEEIKLFESALRRRQLNLILAGKMSPNDAKELKALFQ